MRFTRGTEYKGIISQTADGQTCNKWNESLLMMIDSTLTSVSGSEPYCRNFEPLTGPSPWCFTNYFYISMCEVPFCGKSVIRCHGLLARYVKLWVAHAPGMPGTFSPAPRVSDSGMHHGTCVTHVPWCMSGSLTDGFFWCRWRRKCPRPPRRMRNPQLYLSGKRPIGQGLLVFRQLLGQLSWGSFFKSSHCNSFDDQARHLSNSRDFMTGYKDPIQSLHSL